MPALSFLSGGSGLSGSPGSGGFFSSVGSGLGSFFSGVGNVLGSFAGSQLGGAFLGDLGTQAVNQLRNITGLQKSVVGDRFQVGQPFNTFQLTGAQAIAAQRQAQVNAQIAAATAAQLDQLRAQQLQVQQQVSDARTRQLIADRDNAIFGISQGGSSRVLPPFVPPQTTPGGFNVVAFPTDRSAAFPASGFGAFTQALFNPQGFPVAQQAGLGSTILRQLPALLGGLAIGEGIEGLAGLTAGGPTGTPMFKLTACGASSPRPFRTPDPRTGEDVWFRPAGRPILFSGDFQACKRVARVSKMASKRLRGKR